MTTRLAKAGLAGALLIALCWPGTAWADVDFGLRGGVYTDTEEPFIGGEILFPIGSSFYLNPNLEYVLIDNGDLYTVNLDFHYDFWGDRNLAAWLGAGAALIRTELDPPRGRDRGVDETDFGVNLLAGIGAKRGTLRPYLQGKVILSDDTEAVIAVGLRFP